MTISELLQVNKRFCQEVPIITTEANKLLWSKYLISRVDGRMSEYPAWIIGYLDNNGNAHYELQICEAVIVKTEVSKLVMSNWHRVAVDSLIEIALRS